MLTIYQMDCGYSELHVEDRAMGIPKKQLGVTASFSYDLENAKSN